MKAARFRGLFWPLAGAFLTVAVLAVILQGAVLVNALRDLAARSSGGDVARRTAEAVAWELREAQVPDVAGALQFQQRALPRWLVAYRDTAGRFVFPPFAPRGTGPRDFARLRARWGDPGPPRPPGESPGSAPPGGAPPPGPRPEPGGAPPPPAAEPPPGDAPPGPPHEEGPPPRLAATQAVMVRGRARGEVWVWRVGPQDGRWTSPWTTFFVSLPVTLALASLGGLLLSRALLARLRSLEALTHRVEAGDLDARVDDPRPDEIGELGRSFDRMTASLGAARAELAAADQARRQLFADIAHELATPLTLIRGYSETLADRSVPMSPAEESRYLEHIHGAARRMDLLLHDLLDLARLEAGTVALECAPLDLAALAGNMAASYVARFAEAGVTLRTAGAGRAAWVMADGRRLEQVLTNLLENALRYVGAGGAVELRLETVGEGGAERHVLRVEDDGPGFDERDLPHVFDRFYRGHNAGPVEGTGLGLSIVREIVTRHGGRCAAANRAPRGAVLQFDLPAIPAPAA